MHSHSSYLLKIKEEMQSFLYSMFAKLALLHARYYQVKICIFWSNLMSCCDQDISLKKQFWIELINEVTEFLKCFSKIVKVRASCLQVSSQWCWLPKLHIKLHTKGFSQLWLKHQIIKEAASIPCRGIVEKVFALILV